MLRILTRVPNRKRGGGAHKLELSIYICKTDRGPTPNRAQNAFDALLILKFLK